MSNTGNRFISDQVVYLFQGGGALGSYQVGLYKKLHEYNAEPDWVIGTSIGAINGSIIAGNPPERRYERLLEFWKTVEIEDTFPNLWGRSIQNMNVMLYGVKGFFKLKTNILPFENISYGIYKAAYYDTTPLKETLSKLVDFDYINKKHVRLMVGSIHANSGELVYFDNYKTNITVDHIMASCALPPAFPAINIDGEPYWDGGIASNSPVDVFINTHPRVDSVVFAAHLWNNEGAEVKSFGDIKGRLKDIQFSSRSHAYIQKEKEIHELRKAIQILSSKLTAEKLKYPEIEKLVELGCDSQMHFVQFIAPTLHYDDYTKDINFSKHSISSRMQAGYDDAARAIEKKPWEKEYHDRHGIITHKFFKNSCTI